MEPLLVALWPLVFFMSALPECTCTASEFRLPGDYLLGGLFNIHHTSGPIVHDKPVAIDCSSQIIEPGLYRMFQVMRFAVEQINNSSALLPGVSLGYDIYDHCSQVQNYPAILNLISSGGSVRPHWEADNYTSKVIGVIGPFQSADVLATAPLFTMNLIPVVSYGAASSVFSVKEKFPSFLRTVLSNKEIIHVVLRIIQLFNWQWVVFLSSDDPYGKDGLELFQRNIMNSDICLAYTAQLRHNTDYLKMFKEIESHGASVIVVFAVKMRALDVVHSAIKFNFSRKVWIAVDTWALDKHLPKEKGVENIGTVLGISEMMVPIPGFEEFIKSKGQNSGASDRENGFCNQECKCPSVSSVQIIAEDPSYNFPVYAATYAVAHALHNVLQCGAGKCLNLTVYPFMVLAELKKSNFMLLNESIEFDQNGDTKYASLSIVFWNKGHAEVVGFYRKNPSVQFSINSSKIQWHANGMTPVSKCSPDCAAGHVRRPDGSHKCCFTCEICHNGTYMNATESVYDCISCKETEWSTDGSTSCSPRSVEFVPLTDPVSVLILMATFFLVGLALAIAALLAVNYDSPVVKSAGGPMCFLILGCLSLCSVSIFFYFDIPTTAHCVLRLLPFILFFTVCLACFVVRSFQIICIFKMTTKFPKFHSWWMKYNGQWLVITVALATQVFLFIIGYATRLPKPYNETSWYPDKIILGCDLGNFRVFSISVLLLGSLGFFCFTFSYMGKDLPKNYNEAKAITFCLLLLILTWIIFSTEYAVYKGKYIQTLNAMAVLSSLYCILLWYFLPKCYIIIFQPQKNTPQYFQGLIQSYTKNISK